MISTAAQRTARNLQPEFVVASRARVSFPLITAFEAGECAITPACGGLTFNHGGSSVSLVNTEVNREPVEFAPACSRQPYQVQPLRQTTQIGLCAESMIGQFSHLYLSTGRKLRLDVRSAVRNIESEPAVYARNDGVRKTSFASSIRLVGRIAVSM